LQGCVFVGCADDEVAVEFRVLVRSAVDVVPSPPTSIVADGVDLVSVDALPDAVPEELKTLLIEAYTEAVAIVLVTPFEAYVA